MIMYYTPIGKEMLCGYYGMEFELTENIKHGSNVLLFDYRHMLLLIGVTSRTDIDYQVVIKYISTMMGFSHIYNSPFGTISVEPPNYNDPIQLYINNVLITSIYDKSCNISSLYNNKPSVISIDNHGVVYSFLDAPFEYYLRNINSIKPFIEQINFIL